MRSFRVNVPSELVHEDDNQPQPTAGYPSKEEIETMEQAELDSRDITEGVQEHKDLDTKDNETNDPENMV